MCNEFMHAFPLEMNEIFIVYMMFRKRLNLYNIIKYFTDFKIQYSHHNN